MNRLLYRAAALLFCICILLSGCSTPTAHTDCFHFTDALQRSVCVPKNPQRVACLIGSFADVWQLAGGTVCATADDAWDDFDLTLPDAVNLGKTKSPNVELLLASDPDFVIASASTAANVELLDLLESVNIPVAYFNVDHFSDYLAMLDVCTQLTNRRDLYEQNGLAIEREISAILAEFSASPLPPEQNTVLFLRASAGYIRAKNSSGSILGEMLRDFGVVNIADDDHSLLENLSIESILQADPYRILIVQVGDDASAVKNNINQMMEESPAWRSLSAVSQNRMHYLDKRLFNLKPNAQWAQAYAQLSQLLQN